MSPLVSIIVPIYNVESYLRRCLDSIVNQTYTNLEIILVDDGSPDNCPQICDEYAAKDNRIVVIHRENGGLSDARNVGLDICKGEYISFVDSDDWVNERYIEALFNLTIKVDADIAIGEHEKIYNEQIYSSRIVEKKQILFPLEAIEVLFQRKYLSFILSWGKLYKKHLFDNVKFPKGRFHEDEFTSFILFYNANKIAYTSEILYYYYQRTDSIMSISHPYDLLKAEEKQFDFILKHNMVDIQATQAQLICWQILYIFSSNPSKQLNARLRYYAKFLKIQKNPFTHYFLLKIFCFAPSLYSAYRKISPFLIRK